jgi:hypothetical protein
MEFCMPINKFAVIGASLGCVLSIAGIWLLTGEPAKPYIYFVPGIAASLGFTIGSIIYHRR